MPEADDGTIKRWKTEPRLAAMEYNDASVEQAPPLWKDLTLASALAVLLWGAAVLLFGWGVGYDCPVAGPSGTSSQPRARSRSR